MNAMTKMGALIECFYYIKTVALVDNSRMTFDDDFDCVN